MWDKECLHFKNGYNEYELLWLWYCYHTEKFDSKLPGRPSPWDTSSNIPFHHHTRESNHNAKSLRDYMLYMLGGDSSILDTFKKTFSHFKAREIYGLYEHLDKEGKFEFINKSFQHLEDREQSINYDIFR